MRMSEAHRRPRRHRGGAAALALAAVAGLGLTACQSGGTTPGASTGGRAAATGDTVAAPAVAPVHVTASVKAGASDVPIDREVAVSVHGGSLTSVSLRSPAGSVAGRLAGTGSRWAATGRLEPGASYVLKAVAKRSDGKQVTRTRHFRTEDLTLDQQTYPSVAPLQGETVGVGMPVIVTFDVPVTDRAAFEKHMTVTSTPHQAGSWHWLSSTEVHWRPKTYWKAGTDVHVDVDVNSIPAGNGVYGQESRTVDFHVGDAHVYKVNAQTDQMRVYSNGQLLRTVPITTGKPGFTTRSGTKIIIEKFPSKRMNSETVGITGAEAYNIGNVQWAMRLTYSGEFLHAAPWSVADQGHANVSHGCTGMSTSDAAWLYAMSRRGDVVETTGTDRPMTLTNGYGDWNESFAQWRQGSALS
jgi:lipoprotein-anchoring transpeptidase ErfK/SrfK